MKTKYNWLVLFTWLSILVGVFVFWFICVWGSMWILAKLNNLIN